MKTWLDKWADAVKHLFPLKSDKREGENKNENPKKQPFKSFPE